MIVRAPLSSLLVLVSLATAPLAAGAADTLVTAEPKGGFAAGLATAWKERSGAVVFTLAADADVNAIATELRDKLKNAQVSVESEGLVVRGMALPELLSVLSTTRLAVAWNALDEVQHIPNGAAPTSAKPEAGGSIRASQPVARTPWEQAAQQNPSRRIVDHDPAERLEADVVSVERGAFPLVKATLKLRRSAKVGPLAGKLKKGATLNATIALARRQGDLDFADAATQRNIGAFYLQPGDRVCVHVVPSGAEHEVDFLERCGAR